MRTAAYIPVYTFDLDLQLLSPHIRPHRCGLHALEYGPLRNAVSVWREAARALGRAGPCVLNSLILCLHSFRHWVPHLTGGQGHVQMILSGVTAA